MGYSEKIQGHDTKCTRTDADREWKGGYRKMYIDPGFGGMLIQIIIALIAAGGALVFAFRKKIRALFSKDKKAGGMGRIAESASDTADDAIDMLSDDQ